MFDTMKVAKKIKDARISQNMTQMNLADAMGVSYQAVSNWERGNSMPDISKLEDLCSALSISFSELLGAEARETATVEKIVKDQDVEMTMEELSDIAPMLLPRMVREQAEKTAAVEKYDLKVLARIAPHMDDDFLKTLLKDVQVSHLQDLIPLAPYLDKEMLDQLVRKAPEDDYSGILNLAFYLSGNTLAYLVKRGSGKMDKSTLVGLAFYLDQDTLNWAAKHCAEEIDIKTLKALAFYLDKHTIDEMVDIQLAKGAAKELSELYYYMNKQTVQKVVKALMAEGNLDAMKKAAHYL